MEETTVENSKNEIPQRREKNWPGVLFQLYLHCSLFYGLYFIFQAKLLTLVFCGFLIAVGLLGTTLGAHRLWAHQSYTAHIFLKIFLMLCHTLGGNGPIYNWVLDHRLHHKYHGTDDDPFNYKKGLFYAHLGSKMILPNPNKEKLIQEIDMSDIENDKVVMFQKKFYWILMPVLNLLLPVNAPVEYWGEDMLISAWIMLLLRIPLMFHAIWLVNSGRSVWGLKPNDRYFSDSNLVFLIKKSHWHSYHYQVPWDCFTDEFGTYNSSCTSAFVRIFAAMGLAKELKTIDSKGMTLALERAVDTGKPIGECVTELRDELELFRYEDNILDYLEVQKRNIN